LDNDIKVSNASGKNIVVDISGDSFSDNIPIPAIMQTNLRTAGNTQQYSYKVGEIDLTNKTGKYKLQISKTNPYIHYSGGNGDYIASVY
jgi:hypothetical protein